ncbi:hypothetical protein L484_009868 [Morus notabilis]|uniref:Uncharacterized protein n=1 Tax=Morus notabilis TaxID=981085 RepID=W9R4V2_9ROSA|nr:hypothetical protein L484_009868 [Morus notabilis]
MQNSDCPSPNPKINYGRVDNGLTRPSPKKFRLRAARRPELLALKILIPSSLSLQNLRDLLFPYDASAGVHSRRIREHDHAEGMSFSHILTPAFVVAFVAAIVVFPTAAASTFDFAGTTATAAITSSPRTTHHTIEQGAVKCLSSEKCKAIIPLSKKWIRTGFGTCPQGCDSHIPISEATMRCIIS